MGRVNFNILLEAKGEYQKHLQNILTPHIYEGVMHIYSKSSEAGKNRLKYFQSFLEGVPKWNEEIVEKETERIKYESTCTWLKDLVEAVFVSNTLILVTTSNKKSDIDLEIKIPTESQFIHKCYIEVAREFYKNPYLLDDTLKSSERQKNMRKSLNLINSSIEETVRKLLPIRSILNKYLNDNLDEEDEERVEGGYRIKRLNTNILGILDQTVESDSDSDSDSDSGSSVGGSIGSDTSDEEEEDSGESDSDSEEDREVASLSLNKIQDEIKNEQQPQRPPTPELLIPAPARSPSPTIDLSDMGNNTINNVSLSNNNSNVVSTYVQQPIEVKSVVTSDINPIVIDTSSLKPENVLDRNMLENSKALQNINVTITKENKDNSPVSSPVDSPVRSPRISPRKGMEEGEDIKPEIKTIKVNLGKNNISSENRVDNKVIDEVNKINPVKKGVFIKKIKKSSHREKPKFY